MKDLAKCYCLPGIWAVLLIAGLFILAYFFYLFSLFLFRKIKMNHAVYEKFLHELRYPVLGLFLEVAALGAVQIVNISENVTARLEHIINVLLIVTIGWTAVAITRVFYQIFIEKKGNGIGADITRRSILTQVLFLYKVLMFLICVVTVAAVLLTFPYIKSLGLGILGSAGIAGIALGIAARPILLNFMAGFQIAATKMVKIGDAIFVEGEFARVESIHLTRVVVCTWDLRRIILPISYFIDRSFQNWDLTNPELLGSVFLYCDYTVPVDAIRKKAGELITTHPSWNKRIWNVQVTNCTENTVEIRIVASANDAAQTHELRTYLREKLIDFLQKEYPHALPVLRNRHSSDSRNPE